MPQCVFLAGAASEPTFALLFVLEVIFSSVSALFSPP